MVNLDKIGTRESGYYLLRLRSGGWAVPCRVWQEADYWHFEVDGSDVGKWPATSFWGGLLQYLGVTGDETPAGQLLMFGEPSDEANYLHRTARKRWAALHAPDDPSLHPTRRMKPPLLPSEF